MSAIDKEKIYEKLRDYHASKFPAKIKNQEVENLKDRYIVTEDKIVSMVLSLVNGKAEFVDSTKELDSFQARLDSMHTNKEDEASKNIFVSKISGLSEIMAMAKESDFKLKKIRGAVAR